MELCFKAKRDYLHGSDIYDYLVKNIAQNSQKIELSFHKVAKKALKITDKKPNNLDDIYFVFKYDNNTIYGISSNQDVNCRYEFDEQKIYNSSIIKDKKISLIDKTNFSFIENTIILNKKLLENLYKQEDGKWFFSKLQLYKKIVDNYKELDIVLISDFNLKLFKSEIFLDKISVGYIYFSLKKD